MDTKLIVRARLHSSIRKSGPVSFAISIDSSTTVRAVKDLILQKAQKAPGAPEWNAPSSPSAFIMRLNDVVPLVNEDALVSIPRCYSFTCYFAHVAFSNALYLLYDVLV
jgi:hypothetical protein